MMRKVAWIVGVAILAVAPLSFAVAPALAWHCPDSSPNDFITGGGFIGSTPNQQANFAIGGACKEGGDGHILWGHLEYNDHGFQMDGLRVHWKTITAYLADVIGVNGIPDNNARIICGTATVNSGQGFQGIPPTVAFAVRAADDGEPGGQGIDHFDILVTDTGGTTIYYSTGGASFATPPTPLGGGNIQLHKSIKQITTIGESCPALGIFN